MGKMKCLQYHKRNVVTSHSSVRKHNGNLATCDLIVILAEREKTETIKIFCEFSLAL